MVLDGSGTSQSGVPFSGRDQRVVQNLWLSKMTVVSPGRVYIYNKLIPNFVSLKNTHTHKQAYKHKLKYPCLALPRYQHFTRAILLSSSKFKMIASMQRISATPSKVHSSRVAPRLSQRRSTVRVAAAAQTDTKPGVAKVRNYCR